jgi:hypothetical protein
MTGPSVTASCGHAVPRRLLIGSKQIDESGQVCLHQTIAKHPPMTRFLAFVGTAILMSGCTFFLPHYDPVAGAKVEELTIRSHTLLDEAKGGKLTVSKSERFLNESIGIVSALRAREESDGNDRQRLESLAALNGHLEMLLKRNTSLRVSDAAALGARLAEVQRRYGRVRHGLGPAISTISTDPSDSTDTTTSTTETKSPEDEKEKEKCKRDGDGKKNDRCENKARR